jgi:succinate dehydrogenase / fumarate reductase, flavoprotein subunit
VGDRTGLEMIRTLQDHGVHQGLEVFMECTVTKLLTQDRRVVGAFAYWRETGRFVTFRAKAVVLATGGIGKAYKITSNSWEYTGDGHALALGAGAELIDMEFFQFHPTGMVWPPGVQGLLVTEAVRGEGGLLRNKAGERFMERYDPKRMELSTRDMVSRAIYTEVKEGRGSPHGGVFLDISHKPAEVVKKKLPSMYHQFMEFANIDITKGPMEVGPTGHYAMGGVRVDAETGAATVPGLFAAGESSGGMHGANRLGGNSLSDLLVFGKRAGAGASAYAAKAPAHPGLDPAQITAAEREMLEPFERASGPDPYSIHRKLQDSMQSLVGIYRNEEDLTKGIDEVRELKAEWSKARVEGSRAFNPGWHLAHDLKNMLLISEAVAACALQRKESRGAHARLDYPNTMPEFGKVNSVVTQDGERLVISQSPLLPMPDELRSLFEPEPAGVKA